jgi:hypothetical protein
MKIIFLVYFILGSLAFAQSELKGAKPVTKVPKSLFLVKKAKIDNDVGEPVLYPRAKQEQTLRNESIYRKYNLSDTFKSGR